MVKIKRLPKGTKVKLDGEIFVGEILYEWGHKTWYTLVQNNEAGQKLIISSEDIVEVL